MVLNATLSRASEGGDMDACLRDLGLALNGKVRRADAGVWPINPPRAKNLTAASSGSSNEGRRAAEEILRQWNSFATTMRCSSARASVLAARTAHSRLLRYSTPPMHWLLIAYLIVLVFVAYRHDKFGRGGSLRRAWLAFAAIPLSHFFFTLLRAGNFADSRDLALIEIWSDGIVWLLLGISLWSLGGVLAPDTEAATYGREPVVPPTAP
jgi:hypothetical protein